MLTPLADIGSPTTGVNLRCAICIDASTILYASNLGDLRRTTYFNQDVSIGAGSSTSLSGLALYSAASAIASYSSSSRFDLIDLNTLQVTPVTTSANSTFTAAAGQQLAANASTGFAMATQALAGRVSIINCLTRLSSSFTITGISGQTGNCVIVKDNNFLLGTDNGQIYEINTNGAIVASYQVPRTPGNNNTPNIFPIVSLAYAPSSTVLAATGGGELLAINWPASSLINELVGYEFTYPGAGVALSNYSSGVVVYSSDAPGNSTFQGFSEVFLSSKGVSTLDTTYMNTYLPSGTHDIQIDPSGTRGLVVSNDTNGNTFKIRTFSLTPTSQTTVKTRAQDPVGVDITGSIIRIRDRGYGEVVIDLDQAIAAGDNFPNAANDNNYIEVLLNGATGSSEKWDVREFTA